MTFCVLRSSCKLATQQAKPGNLQGFSKRLMGLEPTTFCMAISSSTPVFQH
jgi:hypothetical protein